MRERNVILNVHKSVISFDNKLWVRKDMPECFDIKMGSINSVQVTDFVGLVYCEKLL